MRSWLRGQFSAGFSIPKDESWSALRLHAAGRFGAERRPEHPPAGDRPTIPIPEQRQGPNAAGRAGAEAKQPGSILWRGRSRCRRAPCEPGRGGDAAMPSQDGQGERAQPAAWTSALQQRRSGQQTQMGKGPFSLSSGRACVGTGDPLTEQRSSSVQALLLKSSGSP